MESSQKTSRVSTEQIGSIKPVLTRAMAREQVTTALRRREILEFCTLTATSRK
jgi:hypothetical protein